MKRIPNFLIVGAPRCGTTTLFRYLEEHPDVYMPQAKELRFFDRNFERGYGWYEEHFSEWDDQTAIGEASPGYMSNAIAIERLADHLPSARLLVSMRNPVDRAYSDYWMMRSLGRETRTFAAAVESELGQVEQSVSRDTIGGYLERGRYADQLERMAKLYPRDSIKTLIFEEFVERPGLTMEEVFVFLGVDPGFQPSLLGQPVNRHVSFRSKTVRRWTKNAPALIRRVVGRLNSRIEPYEALDPALRARLDDYFASHQLALQDWLGRDLDVWRP